MSEIMCSEEKLMFSELKRKPILVKLPEMSCIFFNVVLSCLYFFFKMIVNDKFVSVICVLIELMVFCKEYSSTSRISSTQYSFSKPSLSYSSFTKWVGEVFVEYSLTFKLMLWLFGQSMINVKRKSKFD